MPLENDVNKFIDENYGEIPLYLIREPKIIHLASMGTHKFFKHEIAVIDTPLIQRLKYISQLGAVYNVFPTARHTRFEHTLGVVIAATRIWESLLENNHLDYLPESERKRILLNVRMAAILHDIGHCPFSHASEVVLEEFTPIKSEKSRLKAKPHEILGYYILKSKAMVDFFEEISNEYKINLDLEEISNYILGKTRVPAENQFIADIINGPFDADKFDYILRDSNFSGVPLSLGLDRFLVSLGTDTVKTPQGELRKLILLEKGIMPFEQIVLAKAQLYSAIYHHQKVRALDQMIISILRLSISDGIEVNGLKIKSAVDFLKIDDFDILKLSTGETKLNQICKNLKERQTLKRSLVISSRTIAKDDNLGFQKILKRGEYTSLIRESNKVLAERIGGDCTEFDVALDLPDTPKLGETHERLIKIGTDFFPLKEFFPQEEWIETYIANKWRGHIFATEKYRTQANTKGMEYLEEEFGIKFNDNATLWSKILPSVKPQKEIFDFPLSDRR
ncbi:MAG TPA: HD domain-containing protein [Methanothrix sp.]|nr:HD domain-containing protein [Methanothrix sp.]